MCLCVRERKISKTAPLLGQPHVIRVFVCTDHVHRNDTIANKQNSNWKETENIAPKFNLFHCIETEKEKKEKTTTEPEA